MHDNGEHKDDTKKYNKEGKEEEEEDIPSHTLSMRKAVYHLDQSTLQHLHTSSLEEVNFLNYQQCGSLLHFWNGCNEGEERRRNRSTAEKLGQNGRLTFKTATATAAAAVVV
eukprot:10784535-Ditylum_brightwellii.AAC.1